MILLSFYIIGIFISFFIASFIMHYRGHTVYEDDILLNCFGSVIWPIASIVIIFFAVCYYINKIAMVLVLKIKKEN